MNQKASKIYYLAFYWKFLLTPDLDGYQTIMRVFGCRFNQQYLEIFCDSTHSYQGLYEEKPNEKKKTNPNTVPTSEFIF